MRVRTVFILLVSTVLALVATVALDTSTATSAGGRGFSAVPLRPAAAAALKAQGRTLRFPFPNAINQGRKFAPGGDLVGPLNTASRQRVLVLFVDFTTPPPGGPASRLDLKIYFDSMLFGTKYDAPEFRASGVAYPTDRTLFNYYKAVSYGQVDVVTLNLPSRLGWASSGHPYDYYCKADGIHDYGWGGYPYNVQGLVVDAIKAVDGLVDFSQYAIDGEVPNLFVVHAGTGAEWNSDPSIIWSHSWSLDAYTPLSDGFWADGVKINSYAMMPEVGGDLTGVFGGSGPYPPTVGVYAHEYGHVLGLPDQYDYGYESEGTSIYSLMAGGSWNQWPGSDAVFSGNSPSFLDAWSRYRLGFVVPTEITSTQSVILPPAEIAPVVYKMVVPYSGGKEYFLFENRQQIGFDQGLNVYRDTIAGRDVRGLAIYHIDDVVLSRNYWRPNEAENWKEFRSEGWKPAANGESHYGISILQADGLWDLEHGLFTRFRSDLYPGTGGVTSFGSFTSPNSTSYYFWGGSAPKFGYSGVTATEISEARGTIRARLGFVK